MASISGALSRIKEDLRPFLPDESIESACRAAGHEWRERQFGPVVTLHLFVMQVLNFNTAITALRHLAKAPVKAASYCDARMRLPLAALQSLLHSSAAAMGAAARSPAPAPAPGGAGLWHGLRALLADGSCTIAPDTPALQKEFGQPAGQKAGCGFPVPKVLGLFDAFTGLVVEMLCFPLLVGDMAKVADLHPLLSAGDLLVGDRGFCSYAHLALLHLRGVAGLFRMHQRTIVDFRPHRRHRTGGKAKGDKGRPTSRFVRRLGKWDHVVEWARPKARPKWMTAERYALLPAALLVREIRYRIPRKGQRTVCVTIATTLLDPVLYPKDEVAELYGVRWRVETHFAELKTTLKMRKVKCMTPDGVKKELAVYCLVYNLVHAIMVRAAGRQGVEPHRVSFIDAVRWLQAADPGEELADLVVNPRRPDRHEPRVVKDRQDSYKLMTKPRDELRKALRKAPETQEVKA